MRRLLAVLMAAIAVPAAAGMPYYEPDEPPARHFEPAFALNAPGAFTNRQDVNLAGLSAAGFRWVAYKVQDGAGWQDFDLQPTRDAGLRPAVWGVSYSPLQFFHDGELLGHQAVRLGASDVIADVEESLKNTRPGGAQALIAGIRAGGWTGPVHLSTLCSPSDPFKWDYGMDVDSFLDTGGGVLPQAYLAEDPNYTPTNCLIYWRRMGVPASRINVTLGFYTGPQGRFDAASQVQLLTAAGIRRQFSVFMAQHLTNDDLKELG